MKRYDEIISIEKRYDVIEEVEKFNPYHGKDGRFSNADGYASFTFATKDPNKQYMADMSIMRRTQQNEAARASGKGQPLTNPTGNLKEDIKRELDGADYAVQFRLKNGKIEYGVADFNSDAKDAKGNPLAEGQYGNMKIFADFQNNTASQVYIMDKKGAKIAVDSTNAKLKSGKITAEQSVREFENQVAAQALRTINREYIQQQNEARRNLTR